MELLIFFLTLGVFLLIGVPIAFALILCALVLMFCTGVGDVVIISQQMVSGTDNFPLMAIPFFMLAGEIMARGGLSKQIVEFSRLLLGRIKGGLGYAAILACILFAGLSGAAVAETAALGSILLPVMKDNGYHPDRATGFICAGSIIGPIIPPSIPMIVLGATAGVSVIRLFMGGIVPGVMLGVGLMIVWFFILRKDGYTDVTKYSFREGVAIVKESLLALLLPVILLVGIRFGVFTPTEGGAFAVVYALVICVFWYKTLTWAQVIDIFVAAAKMTAVVMFIVAGATAVGWFVTIAQIPAELGRFLSPLIDKPFLLILVLNAFLFVMGMVLDITPNILIFAPVIFPVIEQAGIDPVFFGLLMVLNLCIGLITPPVGIVLYVGCSVGKVQFTNLVRSLLPFLAVELVVLVLLMLFPGLITVPVDFLMGGR